MTVNKIERELNSMGAVYRQFHEIKKTPNFRCFFSQTLVCIDYIFFSNCFLLFYHLKRRADKDKSGLTHFGTFQPGWLTAEKVNFQPL